MNWKLVLLLSTLGIVYAALTITGLAHGHEAPTILVTLVICAALVAGLAPTRPFRHGFTTGAIAGVAGVLTQALFLPIYFKNNPGYDAIPIPFGMDARLATAVFSPIHGVLAGMLVGATAWLIARLLRSSH